MIAYSLTVIRGCIHTPFMELLVGDQRVGIKCGPLRAFIRLANEKGLDEALARFRGSPRGRNLIITLYEEFKDEEL